MIMYIEYFSGPKNYSISFHDRYLVGDHLILEVLQVYDDRLGSVLKIFYFILLLILLNLYYY